MHRDLLGFMFAASAVVALLAQTSSSPSPSPRGRFDEASCEALNRRRNIEMHRRKHLTRAVLCDTTPA